MDLLLSIQTTTKMTKEIDSTNKMFEDIKKVDEDGVEYWSAREMQVVLDYGDWRNFAKVIEKAKISCGTSGFNVKDHFVDVNEMVKLGSGSSREIDDFKLSRYACYLIAQNGDPTKEQIALAQTYFAVKTRERELLKEQIEEIKRIEAREKLTITEKKFAETLYERNVDGKGISEIRATGDKILFGGYDTKQMKNKLGVKQYQPLADFLPTVSIKAKDFASEMTIVNTKNKDLVGKYPIKEEHTINSKGVRTLLEKRMIYPENLPPEENIQKVKTKYKGLIGQQTKKEITSS